MAKSATAKQMGFHFRPVFKGENTQKNCWCLPAKIIDDLKRVLIEGLQNISDTAKRAASKLREKIGCHCDDLRQRFLVIIWDLVLYDP